MEQPTVIFTRDIDLPRVIVWDALVDPDLVSGWLAEAEIEPVVGGVYNLVWAHRKTESPTFGRITLLQHPERLTVDTANLGILEFSLTAMDGGFRDTGTRVQVTVELPDGDLSSLARITADWLTNLEQLEELLHGRPVDWVNWERDRHDSWAQRFHDAANSTA